jgi:transcription initiation factor TFIIIB Brf1 subunit/transcription initiation factor TFIIB
MDELETKYNPNQVHFRMDSYQLDDEYLEIFGKSKINYQKVLQTLEKNLFDGEPCKHSEKKVVHDIKEICCDCGMETCFHKNTYEDDNGLNVCHDCGVESEMFDFKPEWRYYGSSDNKITKDPSRCRNKSRSNSRGIDKVFEESRIEIPEAVKAQINVKYNKVIGPNVARGKCRKGIIAACWFHVYRDFGYYRTTDYIGSRFNLSKKNMSDGLTAYYEAFPEDRTAHTTAENLLEWILSLTGINKVHYRKIVTIARYLDNSSRLLKRSSPQSVATAVVYFYLCLNPRYKSDLGLTKSKFAEKARLSDITVTKLVKEASMVSNCIIEM